MLHLHGEHPREDRGHARQAAWRLLTRGYDLVSERFDDMRIEVVGDPLLELGESLMLEMGDRFEQFAITPRTADVLGRTAIARLYQPR